MFQLNHEFKHRLDFADLQSQKRVYYLFARSKTFLNLQNILFLAYRLRALHEKHYLQGYTFNPVGHSIHILTLWDVVTLKYITSAVFF